MDNDEEILDVGSSTRVALKWILFGKHLTLNQVCFCLLAHNGGVVLKTTSKENEFHTSYNPSTMNKIIKWHGTPKYNQAIQGKW